LTPARGPPIFSPRRPMTIAHELEDFTFRTWAGTYSRVPDRLYRPRNTDEVAGAVAEAIQAEARIRVTGLGRACSAVACPAERGWSLSTARMNRVIEVDRTHHRVRAQAGIRLADLAFLLAQHGLALPNLQTNGEATLGGLFAGASHGFSPQHGGLGDAVHALQFVDAEGRVREHSVDEPDGLAGLRAHFGALGARGIVTELSLAAVPAFGLEARTRRFGFDEGLASVGDALSRFEYVRLFWWPFSPFLWRTTCERTTAPVTTGPATGWTRTGLIGRHLRRAVSTWGASFPEQLPRLAALAGRFGPLPARCGARSDRLLLLPPEPVHRAMAYALPAENLPDALCAVRTVVETQRLPADAPIDVWFSPAEDAPLSPAWGRPTATVVVRASGALAADVLFPAVHGALTPFDVHPHLGFLHGFEPASVLSPEQRASLRDADPRGLFRNDFLDALVAA
jgi:FAD/FMN-containing dehydrogenase